MNIYVRSAGLISNPRANKKKKNLAHVVSLQVFKERCGGGRKKKNLSGEAGGRLCTTNVKESLLRGLVATSFVIF